MTDPDAPLWPILQDLIRLHGAGDVLAVKPYALQGACDAWLGVPL